jgi:multicomponent Na+:H+ antiporter subunit D
MFTIFGSDSVITRGHIRDVMLLVLLILGVIASIVGGIMMAVQRDVKRLLGYSSISHIGFIYIAIGLTSSVNVMQQALMASIFHMINYIVSSSLLFLSVIAMEKYVNSRNIDELAGLGRVLPLIGFSIAIGVLNLIGVPPLGGFYSKFMLYQVALEASQPVVAIVIVVATAITLMGYMKLLYIVFGKTVAREKLKEPLTVSIPVVLLALICIVLGLTLTIGFMDILKELAIAAYNYGPYTKVFYDYMKMLFPR